MEVLLRELNNDIKILRQNRDQILSETKILEDKIKVTNDKIDRILTKKMKEYPNPIKNLYYLIHIML